jgi:hypothetical protein
MLEKTSQNVRRFNTNIRDLVSFEVFVLVQLMILFLWNMLLREWVKRSRHFEAI